jgi:hypothetical protein
LNEAKNEDPKFANIPFLIILKREIGLKLKGKFFDSFFKLGKRKTRIQDIQNNV